MRVTVEELIKHLAEYPQDAQVTFIETYCHSGIIGVSSPEIAIDHDPFTNKIYFKKFEMSDLDKCADPGLRARYQEAQREFDKKELQIRFDSVKENSVKVLGAGTFQQSLSYSCDSPKSNNSIDEKCHRCQKAPASVDYNGHGYFVCDPCNGTLEKEFDEDYR